MHDPQLPFSIMPFDRFRDAVVAAVDSAAPLKRPAFALVLGSGFSYPLVPTAFGMMRDIPWWLRTQQMELPFAECPTTDTAVNAHAAALWKKVDAETGTNIEFDNAGLPKHSGDNIGLAYREIMSSTNTSGLFNQELQCAYLRDVVKRIGKQINFAHLFLGAILQAQHSGAWNHKRPFCRTILTTNFDALLQRSLQLHGQLYFMSDQPDVYVEDPTDDNDAVHLFYTHGSIHRPFVANSESALQEIRDRNAGVFKSYFEQHGVIIMGYGGWDDSIMKALQLCTSFKGNLYWCDIYSPQDAATSLRKEASELLRKHRRDAFYVQLPMPGGADSAFQELHKALGLGAYPLALRDPLAGLIDSIESVTIPDKLPGPASDEGIKLSDTIAPVPLKTQIIARLKEFRNILNGTPGEGKESISNAAKDLMTRALSLALNGETKAAQEIWTTVITLPQASSGQKDAALFNRGFAKGQMGDTKGEIEDYTAVIDMPDAPAELKAMALVNRGFTKRKMGDTKGEIEDYTAVIDMPDGPAEQKAKSLFNRGLAKGQMGDTKGAIDDYAAVINMPEAPTEQKAMVLVNRAFTKGQTDDTKGALDDYTAVIDMPDAPAEQKAKASLTGAIPRAGRAI